MERKNRLWKSDARKLVLCGIAACDGSAVIGKSNSIGPLCQAWASIFQAQPDESQTAAFDHLLPFVQNTNASWMNIPPPCSKDFQLTAKHSKGRKPGADTISDSAWDSLEGGETLQLQFFSNTSGVHYDLDFNQNVAAFCLKEGKGG